MTVLWFVDHPVVIAALFPAPVYYLGSARWVVGNFVVIYLHASSALAPTGNPELVVAAVLVAALLGDDVDRRDQGARSSSSGAVVLGEDHARPRSCRRSIGARMLSPRELASAGIQVRRTALAVPRLSEGAFRPGWFRLLPRRRRSCSSSASTTSSGDAWSRITNAYYVLYSRDPHLAAIGFIWNPLPSLMAIPSCR